MLKAGDLGWVRAQGSPREIGRALGQTGRAAVQGQLVGSALWEAVTGAAHAPAVARMAQAVQSRFPKVWQEIEGLAEGLALPVAQVFAWNCRGDLLAHTPDGCTTVMLPGAVPVIAHNEDGLPGLRGLCFLAEVQPEAAPGFVAFCYPGSIPGHSFAVTKAGLVQAVNNIRLTGLRPDLPRMVLGRAVLGCEGLGDAIELLQYAPSGGFHFALSHCRDRRLLSVEFGGGACSVVEVSAPAAHANHALHLPHAGQSVTQSSADRQARADILVGAGLGPLEVLRDAAGPGLPIRRDAVDDPDEENTHATAVMTVRPEGVEWAVYDAAVGGPAYHGR